MKGALATLLYKLIDDDEEKRLDRLAWYIIKLVGAAEDVKQYCVRSKSNECRAMLTKFVNIVKEVDERLGFRGTLAPIANEVIAAIEKPRVDALKTINEAVKRFVKYVLLLAR